MKKRILALAMTIAMVFSSMAVLSTVSFAADDHDDCVHFDATLATVDAYHATVTVDGKGGADEPYVMVQEYLANGTRYGVAWDYDYIYVIFAAATKKLSAVEFTVGATEVKVDVATATVTGVEGAKAAGNADYLEVAIPLKAVTLHFTQTAAYAPLAAEVVSNATSGATSKINVNVEITGKNLIVKYGANDGATRGFVGYASERGKFETNTNGEFEFSVKTGNANKADSSRFQALGVAEMVEPSGSGVALYSAWELYITSMAESAAPATFPKPNAYQSDADAGKSGILFMLCTSMKGGTAYTAGNGLAYMAYVYNDATDGLVMLVTKDGSSADSDKIYLEEDFDIDVGEYFKVEMVVNPYNTVHIFVNGVSTGVHYVETVSANGYVSGGALGSVQVGFLGDVAGKLRSNELYTVADVDYAKVKSVAKNGADYADKIVTAVTDVATEEVNKKYIELGAPINLGSITELKAGWNLADKVLYFDVIATSLNAITLKNGDASTTVTFGEKDLIYTATASGLASAKVEKMTASSFNHVFVTIPLKDITVRADSFGNVFADFEIEIDGDALDVKDNFSVLFSFDGETAVSRAHRWGSYSGASPVNGGTLQAAYIFANGNAYYGYVEVDNNATFDKPVFGTDYKNVDDNKYFSFDVNFDDITPVSQTDARNCSSDGSHANLQFFIRFMQGDSKKGLNVYLQNVIPANGTASDATINLLLKGNVLVDTNKKVGEAFNLKVVIERNGDLSAYVDGVYVGGVSDALISASSYVHPTSSIIIGYRASKNDGTLNFTVGGFASGFTYADAIDMTVAEFMALTKNTATDVPAYEDVEEAIELNAVQNFGKASDTDYSQRFVATIDTLDYKYAGFQTAKEVTGGYARNTYRVFTGNTSILEGEEEVEAPEGKYFVTYTFDKNSALVNQTFFVRTFVVDADRKFTYGDTYKVTVNAEGQMTSAELVLNPTIFG